jgi:hypothetical protein
VYEIRIDKDPTPLSKSLQVSRSGIRIGLMVVVLLAGLTLTACVGLSSDGVTSVDPSSAQLTAMGSYFLDHFAGAMGNGPPHEGCVTYSMGTQPETNHRLIAYTQVICAHCPLNGGFGGITPAVFVLHGESVLSAKADTEPGDPMFANVISRIFPPSLQSAANEAQVPNANALSQWASKLGGC